MSEPEHGGAPQAEEGRVPPYISFKTLLTLMKELEEHGMPNRIDRSVLGRFSGSSGSQLMVALRWLGLVDADMKPQPALNSLVEAFETPEWPAALGSLLKDRYRFAIALDLSKATPSEFSDAFRKFGAKEAVAAKCKRFFLQAAQASDIEVNQRLLQRAKPQRSPRQRPARAGSQSGESPGPPNSPESRNPPIVEPSHYDLLIEILDPAEMSEEEQQAVWTLIRYLKAREDD
ncbi:MAG: DUF5343 domain-containing protein [Bryobacterales bacterium]|nr:DUF5343 domain-containing protein [Bryobacterales bacterium]